MRMYDLIEKKKHGEALSGDEIAYMIRGFVSGEIPDYQMAAMLMAVYFQGMTDEETAKMTMEMAASGDMVDLSPIAGVKADKHSTGGVGDKTTLVIVPIVAANGVKVAKMSGRGLGHTGGTIDKLESIPGFHTAISQEDFFRIVNETGAAVVGQTGNLVPADKKLYALRDVTATVDSIPLIASSIMSKKIAAGSNAIVLDVKTGSGAFMKTLEDSILLAEKMVAIGTHAGRSCCALITDMDVPLGHAVGNALELQEAIEILRGQGPEDLKEVCLSLAANMLFMAGKGTLEECRELAETSLENGTALTALKTMAESQGGDGSYILHPEKLTRAPFSMEVKAHETGFITHMDAEAIGIASVCLGAGRSRKDEAIDYGAGILLKKKYREKVEKGETLAVLYASRKDLLEEGAKKLMAAYKIGQEEPPVRKLVYARVTKDGSERF